MATRGTVTLHTGTYPIAAHVWFEVRATDAGVELLLCDGRIDAEYGVTVDERGDLVHGGVRPLSGPDLDVDFLPSRPQEWVQVKPPEMRSNALLRAAAEDPLKAFPAYAKHRFTLLIGPTARDRKQAWPLAGYEGERGAYVFYRRPNGPRRGERLLRIVGDSDVAIVDDNDPGRLPEADWPHFFHLTAGKRFNLHGAACRKMSVADVAAAVGGKVFVCLPA